MSTHPERRGVFVAEHAEATQDILRLETITSEASQLFYKTRHGSIDSLRRHWYGTVLFPGNFNPNRYPALGVSDPVHLRPWEVKQSESEIQNQAAQKNWATALEHAYLLNQWNNKTTPKTDLDKIVYGAQQEGWHEINSSLDRALDNGHIAEYAETALWFRLYSPEHTAHLSTNTGATTALRTELGSAAQNNDWSNFALINLSLRTLIPEEVATLKLGTAQISGIKTTLEGLKGEEKWDQYFRLATLATMLGNIDEGVDPTDKPKTQHIEGGNYREREALKHLEDQYNRQRVMLRDGALVMNLGSREGILGIDRNVYPVPEFDEIAEAFEHNKEFYWRALQRGANSLLLVPFALSQSQLLEAYKTTVLNKYEAGFLEFPKFPANYREYNLAPNADKFAIGRPYDRLAKGRLYYYPDPRTDNITGTSKEGVLEQSALKPAPGWNVLLHGGTDNQPQTRRGDVGTPPVVGFTPEDYFIFALNHLDRNNEIVDTNLYVEGRASVSLLKGAEISTISRSRRDGTKAFKGTPLVYWAPEWFDSKTEPDFWGKNWGRLHLTSTQEQLLGDEYLAKFHYLSLGTKFISRTAFKVL